MAIYPNILQEKGYWKKVTLGLKINKGHFGDTAYYLKQHKNEKLLQYVQSCNDIDMLNYIAKDTAAGERMIKTILERIEQLEKYPDLKTSWSDGIKKKYIDKGVTSSDVKAFIKWEDEVLKPAISKRKKELQKK